jgi:hypothetical protein
LEGVNAQWFVLQSAAFRISINTPSNGMAFGLSPKFSTPVEKAVEIHGFACTSEAFSKIALGSK